MKRVLSIQKGVFALLLALGLGMGTAYAYSFSATCSTGQTLYYNIINSTQQYVEITSPGPFPYSWDGYTKPTGNITLPSSVTYNGVNYTVTKIGVGAFEYCSGLTGSLTIPYTVTSIANYAFLNCSGFTGSLNLPTSVTTIGEYAFAYTNFTGQLTIPTSVTTIGNNAFVGCVGFTSVVFNAVNCADVSATDTPFEDCGGSLTIGNNVQRVPAYMFNGAGFTGTLTIGTGVTSIGKCAFKDCTGFTQLNYNAINCTLYTLNDNNERETPFYGCGGTLNIGNSVQTIPDYLLYHCSDFTGSLTIPNSVTSISSYAFRGCTGFTGTLTVPASLTSLSDGAFSDCTGFTYVYYNAANCADVTSQTSPFYNCHGQLSIGSSVQRIPAYMFKDGGFTGSLTIPNSVTSIGNSAFYYCTGFSGSLTLSADLTSIGNYAFFACGFSGSLTLPADLTSIGNYAFFGCSGFSGPLTIGSAVTSIGSNCFSNVFNLSSLTVLPNTPPSLGSSAFQNVPTTIPVYVPCASLEDYQAASGWSAFTNMQCRETLTVYEGTSTNRNVPAYIYYFDR